MVEKLGSSCWGIRTHDIVCFVCAWSVCVIGDWLYGHFVCVPVHVRADLPLLKERGAEDWCVAGVE